MRYAERGIQCLGELGAEADDVPPVRGRSEDD